jgi:hypothetical protein
MAQDGRQVCCPSWIWETSLCYILLNKFVALVGSGRQTCCPSRDEKGLKDWANPTTLIYSAVTSKIVGLAPGANFLYIFFRGKFWGKLRGKFRGKNSAENLPPKMLGKN